MGRKEVAMPDRSLEWLDLGALAYVLFASPLQPSQCPSAEAIKAAIEMQLCPSRGGLTACVGLAAQEAGDHPDQYAARMRWAWRTVTSAYAGHPDAHALHYQAAVLAHW
jgi:hypothetical protein